MTYPKLIGRIELLVGKQLVELVTGLDPVSLVVLLGAEGLGNVGEVPGLDVIVLRIPSVDVSLDGVSFVADHEPTKCKHAKGEDSGPSKLTQ
jgi:hypothetical protein